MLRTVLIAAALASGLAVTASAETVKFTTTMTAQEEVPPTNSKGSGNAEATLDTQSHQFTYRVTWGGFASQVIAAHFHGPAAPGKNAGVQVPIDGSNPQSPATGSATLTPEQQQQLMSGMWYVNVHTKNHPPGAIRGQLKQAG
jgi:hypothetical protein